MAGWWSVIFGLGLSRMITVDLVEQRAGSGLLEQVNNGVVNRVTILVKPASDVVAKCLNVTIKHLFFKRFTYDTVPA